MLKIETSSPSATELSIVLTGWIRREHLPELERLVREARAAHRGISLDLQHVGLVDREVVDFLATGAGRDLRLHACPGYVREWLASLGRATHDPS